MSSTRKKSKPRPQPPKELDSESKLSAVRIAMGAGDWDRAIVLAGRFQALGPHAPAIRRARDAMNNPEIYRELGYDLNRLRTEAIAALKERFSKSWAAAHKS